MGPCLVITQCRRHVFEHLFDRLSRIKGVNDGVSVKSRYDICKGSHPTSPPDFNHDNGGMGDHGDGYRQKTFNLEITKSVQGFIVLDFTRSVLDEAEYQQADQRDEDGEADT